MSDIVGWDVLLKDSPQNTLVYFVKTWEWPKVEFQPEPVLDAFCLNSELINSDKDLTEAEQVYDYVESKFLPMLNGIIRLNTKGEYAPIALYVVYPKHADGSRGTGFSRTNLMTEPLRFQSGGVINKPIPDWLTLTVSPNGEINKNILDVLTLVQQKNAFNWYEMYKIFEIIKTDLNGNINLSGISKNKIGDFTQTANAEGNRHARTPAKKTMTLNEAESFIRELCIAWLNSKL